MDVSNMAYGPKTSDYVRNFDYTMPRSLDFVPGRGFVRQATEAGNQIHGNMPIMCSSLCYIEEQSTTPMRAYRILTDVESNRLCALKCGYDNQCVSASYSEQTRVCHLQVPTTDLTCPVPPFRRFVKTNTNCVPDASGYIGVTYVRTNLSLEHGVDPCVPAALLHSELVTLDVTGKTFPCPNRSISGADGPLLYLRVLNTNGTYESYGINSNTKFSYEGITNTFHVDCKQGPQNSIGFAYISGFCAEAEEKPSESECCAPLPPSSDPALTAPTPPSLNTVGACSTPGQSLNAIVYQYFTPVWFRGNTAKIFCAGGFWMVGDDDPTRPGQTFRITEASCGN